MKRTNFSWPWFFVFFCAGVLVCIGAGMVLTVSAGFENVVLQHTDHPALMEWLQSAAWRLALGGGLLTAGLIALAAAFLQIFYKTGKMLREAEALRQKNEAMQALNRETQQLAHHQRLQTIGTLTASIAHEFNNLLTPIMGYSVMALEQLPPESELYDGMVEIYHSAQKAKEIIARLSELSRKNSDNFFRPVSPDEVIRKTLGVANPAKPAGTDIRLNLNCWDQRIEGNEIQLSQLILNLMLNSFHAIGEAEGVLTISTSFDEDNVQISVTDTGCGIPTDVLPRIFDPFFTTKDTGKGTGLGLAIAAQVIEDHHGHIQVSSQVGKGTSMVITLPRSVPHEAEKPAQPEP